MTKSDEERLLPGSGEIYGSYWYQKAKEWHDGLEFYRTELIKAMAELDRLREQVAELESKDAAANASAKWTWPPHLRYVAQQYLTTPEPPRAAASAPRPCIDLRRAGCTTLARLNAEDFGIASHDEWFPA